MYIINYIIENPLRFYLPLINIISGILFAKDKLAAVNLKSRVPELILHFLELIGGVFSIIILMHSLKHKNRKLSYHWFTWLILIVWTFGIIVYNFQIPL